MADWISVEEAAELSGYNEEYLRRLIRDGKIRAQKKGWQWWVDKTSVLTYLKTSRQSSDQRHGPKS